MKQVTNFDMGRWFTDNRADDLGRLTRNAAASLALYDLCQCEPSPCPSCSEPEQLLQMARAAYSTAPGAFVEAGVFWGGSAYYLTALAKAQGRPIYLYDTFEGLPCEGPLDELKKGTLVPDEESVRKNLGLYPIIVKGVFPHVQPIPDKVAFAHIDVDQYQSTKEAIAALVGRMVSGGIMWFDDTNTLEGARQAVRESFRVWDVDALTGRWYARF